jgi:hypothetical protein
LDNNPTNRRRFVKYKTTSKAIRSGYYHVITAGYCELDSLLKHRSPVAYNAGCYGWNYDVYDIGGIAICTGYRGMPQKNTNATYELIRSYNTKAQGKTRAVCERLLKNFIQKAINN